jgi:hypothetical protein
MDWPLLLGNITVLIIAFCSLIYAARCYALNRTWANFFILRTLVGCLIAEICSLFSLQLNLWSQIVTIQITFTLAMIGTLSQSILSVYRFAIFEKVLPKWTVPFLQFKRYAAFFVICFIIHFIPLSIVLYPGLDVVRTEPQIIVAVTTAWFWYVLWQVFDFGLCFWSLILAFKIKKSMLAKKPLSAVQRKYFILCVAALICLLISDIAFWPRMTDLIQNTLKYDGIFDERAVPELKIAAPLMVLHISMSFVYLHLNIQFISSSREVKETTTAPVSQRSAGPAPSNVVVASESAPPPAIPVPNDTTAEMT